MPPVTNTFPFDAPASYGSDIVAKALDAMTATGYVAGVDSELQVVASSPVAMTVEIKPGKAFIQGRMFELSSGGTNQVLTVTANATGSTRYDRVVLRVDYTAKTITLLYRTGGNTSGSYALIRTSTQYEISLAEVAVPNGASSVSSSDIRDERNDTTVCGVARTRGLPAVHDPLRPVSMAPNGGTFVRIAPSVSSQNVTVTASKMWYFLGVYGSGTGTITAGPSGSQRNVLSGYTSNNPVNFPQPVPLDAGWIVTLPANVGMTAYEVPRDPTRVPSIIHITGQTAGTGTAIATGKRFLGLHVWWGQNVATYLFDTTLGTSHQFWGSYAYTRMLTTPAIDYQIGVYSASTYAPAVQFLREVIWLPGNKTYAAPSATGVNPLTIFGILEDSVGQ